MPKSHNSKTLEALSHLSRQPETREHLEAYIAEVHSEKNDRGAAILMATIVENSLSTAIERRLDIDSPEIYKELFGGDGPIGTFSNRIRIGRALAIYGNVTHKSLHYVRCIRNAFAHTRIPINFATQEVIAACDLMAVPPVIGGSVLLSLVQDVPGHNSARNKFKRVCDILSNNLLSYSMDALQQFPESPVPSISGKYQYLLRPIPLP